MGFNEEQIGHAVVASHGKGLQAALSFLLGSMVSALRFMLRN